MGYSCRIGQPETSPLRFLEQMGRKHMKSPFLSAAIVAGSFLAASVAWAQAPAVPDAPAASGQGDAAPAADAAAPAAGGMQDAKYMRREEIRRGREPAAGAMDHAKGMMDHGKGMMDPGKARMDHAKSSAHDAMGKMAPAEKK
jgi:hypothetical protein